jgi:hypothetical protein
MGGMEHAAVMVWSGEHWGIALPVTVCRVAPLTTAADGRGHPEAFETEVEAYALGYRWCECFTVICPDGELGHVQEPLLLPLARAEFEAARYAVRTGDDSVLDMWLSYRLNAVREELSAPGSFSGRDRVLAPITVIDVDGRPWPGRPLPFD